MTIPRPERSPGGGGETSFFEELVAELRREGFSGKSFLAFLSSAYERARDEVYSNPLLARSTLGWGFAFFAALFVYCAGLSVFLDHNLAVRSLVAGSIWLGLSCAWTLAHAGLARDRFGRRIERVNVPTVLTLFRSHIVPLIVVSAISGHHILAGALFALGGISDILDGVVARRLDQTTRLGTVMDHLVDILFTAAMFISLAAAGFLSPWIGLLVGVRYGLVLLGGACICFLKGPVKIRPTIFGRLSGVMLYLMILTQIAVSTYGEPRFAGRLSELFHVGFVFVLSSTILQAMVIGWYNLKRNAASAWGGKIAGDVRWQ